MSINLYKEKFISISEIALFENIAGVSLPSLYRDFLLKFNGAEPEVNIFKVDQNNDSGVNGFIPITQILNERKFLDHVGKSFFPIAWAEGGNYVVINIDDGIIYFWDHEEPNLKHNIAPNIDKFLENLKPFDSSKVELKEGQVEKAWIDPEFLKNLK